MTNNTPLRRSALGSVYARFANPAFALLTLSMITWAGCAVPQPRGAGKLSRIVEPTTQRGYWLYLPKDYVKSDEAGRKSRSWPIVVSFHGMKPFDSARAQALEWQQESDRYGFVTVAPELGAPDLFQEFPLRSVHPEFQKDERCTLAILDHVVSTTGADPTHTLATGWSSGGYMAHYMMNRHPDRFTALGVRQANFSAAVLDYANASRSKYHPIFIANTENDFAVCKRESKEAVQWYHNNGYRNVAWVYIKNLGHERTPDLAADFFARVAGVKANRPSDVLVKRQAIDGNPDGLALLAGKFVGVQSPTGSSSVQFASAAPNVPSAPPVRPQPTPPRNPQSLPFARPATPPQPRPTGAAPTPTYLSPEPARPVTVARLPRSAAPAAASFAQPPAPAALRPPTVSTATPARQAPAAPTPPRERAMVSIRVSSAIGMEPLYLGFSADCPSEWQDRADFLWTLNGDPVCNGINGQKTLSTPGEHTLGLLVVTPDGSEHRAYRLIRVLPRISASGHAVDTAGG